MILNKSGSSGGRYLRIVPPKVEYSHTGYGKTLISAIITLRQWVVKRLLDFPELMKDNEQHQHLINQINEIERLGNE